VKPEFVHQTDVSYIDHMGDDRNVLQAMLVSTGRDDTVETMTVAAMEGRINFLMRERHASPFEHASLTVLVDVPIFVAREWMRHRTLSYNETSGRYREMEPRFYAPFPSRPLVQVGKAADYELHEGSQSQYVMTDARHQQVARIAWAAYREMLHAGVAREVARNVLPVSTMTQFYASGNLRAWLNFLSLRTTEHALHEIRDAAEQIEALALDLFPLTTQAWIEQGRPQL